MLKQEVPISEPLSNKHQQLATQLVQSFGQMSSMDELKRHAKLLLKSVQCRSIAEQKESTEETQLLNSFYVKLLERLKQLYPAMFKHNEQIADRAQLLAQELENDKNLFSQIGSLLTVHSVVQAQLQELFEREYRLPERPTKGGASRRPIRKAPKIREEPEPAGMLQSHVYVRLMAKSQNAMQYMLKNKNFPRLQLKMSVTQCLRDLVSYLEDKWIKGARTHKLILYPDQQQFLRKLKLRQETEPLNMYYMMTDLLSAYDYPKNNIVGIYYEFAPVETSQMRLPANKSSKPTIKKIFELGSNQEQKYNPFLQTKKSKEGFKPEQPEINNEVKTPPQPSKPDDQYEINIRYQSIQLNNDSLDFSLFRRPGNNSNSIVLGPCNYSNRSLMGFGFMKREETVNYPAQQSNNHSSHLDALRETIRLVDGEEKQKPQQSFSVVPESQVMAVPVIKRKHGNLS